jgi:glycosyltransferase involved in cell wall biosynthesis
MSVYIVCDTLGVSRGGIERHASGFAEGLADAGVNVKLVSTSYLARQNNLGPADHVVVEGIHRGSLSRLLQGHPRLAPNRLSIFTHGSFYEYCHLAELAKAGYSRWLVLHCGRYIFDYGLARSYLSRFGTVAVMCSEEGNEISRAFDLPPEQLFVSPNFTSRSRLGEQSFNRWIPEGPYVFAASRIELRKNLHSVFPALDGLGISFVLAGSDAGGLGAVKKASHRYTGVTFAYLGEIEDDYKRYLVSHSIATVLPSHLEGIPFAVLESLELRTPSIVTSASYVPPWDGIYYCTTNPASIRAAVRSVVSQRAQLVPPRFPDLGTVVRQFIARIENT